RMTVIASSGDDGAALSNCDGTGFIKAVGTPASIPSVLGIGGTELTANSDGKYVSETAWNEPDFNRAGGGGDSELYREPRYQRFAEPTGHRGVPDVAYNAGIGTGVLVAWAAPGEPPGTFFIFGGTSAGSPQWAGLVALTDQAAHRRVGFINNDIYLLG